MNRIDMLADVAAEHDIRTATGHVGGNRNDARLTRLRHDLGFTFVLLGVKHLVFQFFTLEQRRQQLGVFNRGGTHQNRATRFMLLADVSHDGVELFLFGAVDLILLVFTHGRAMRWDDHGFQPVNLLEFIGFGIGRTGHTRQLAVHTEVVLEGNRGQRLILMLNGHTFFGFDGLVQTIGPAATAHQSTGELINNHHFIVLHHVLLIAIEQMVRAQCRRQVMHQQNVGRFVQAVPFSQQPGLRQNAFGTFVAFFCQQNLVGFFIHPEIARAIFCFTTRERRGQCIHPNVQLGMVFGLARDNQRRAGFIDQNRIDFIDDGVMQFALYAILHVVHHVVAQIIKTEFVVGTVSNIAGISCPLFGRGHLRQIAAHFQT